MLATLSSVPGLTMAMAFNAYSQNTRAEASMNVLNGGNNPYHTAPAHATGHRYLHTHIHTNKRYPTMQWNYM